MLRGDISNQRSYVLGFRCEGTLINFKEDGLKDSVLNFVFGKLNRADVNVKVKSLMDYIYWNTEYTVLLVIDEKNYTKEMSEFLSDFPFNQVCQVIRSVSEVTMMLNTGEMTYYIDDNDESRYKVQSRYAITSKELNTVLKRNFDRLRF